MKLNLVILFILFNNISLFAQEIQKISIEYQEANEPPATPAPPKYFIEFSQDKTGNLVAGHYYKDKKKIKFDSPQSIDNECIKIAQEWLISNKKMFTLTDLGIDYSSLTSEKNQSSYKLNFDIPENFVIHIDSFNFCQQQKMQRSISNGGYNLQITLKDNLGKETKYRFDSNDTGEAKFNFQNYLICYQLLKNVIFPEFAKNNIFTRQNLLEMLFYYQQTIECEGFYYQEFNKKNPNRTPQERRMMKDWNFVEYMKQRN